ncbi:MAG TPA: hypothetical protein VFG91_02565 [Woeseiaceae bacterium]|nr:hypothetical protein [Woeseiaceae bacterium]
MPLILSALFLLAVGGGVLAAAWRGYRKGVLPAGPNFFRGRWMPSRAANPFAFHFFLALYFAGGMTLTVWGLLSLVGMAPPLPLR